MLAQSNLYRQFFTPEECNALDRCDPDSAVSEIALLRILITRVLASARASEAQPSIAHPWAKRPKDRRINLTLRHRFSMLTAFCQAAVTMASLARFEFKRNPPPDPILAALAEMDPDDL